MEAKLFGNGSVVGKVVWFNNAKGFGFLQAEGLKDVFCHYSGILTDGYKSLRDGDVVEFDVTQGDKGLQAANVRATEERTPSRG